MSGGRLKRVRGQKIASVNASVVLALLFPGVAEFVEDEPADQPLVCFDRNLNGCQAVQFLMVCHSGYLEQCALNLMHRGIHPMCVVYQILTHHMVMGRLVVASSMSTAWLARERICSVSGGAIYALWMSPAGTVPQPGSVCSSHVAATIALACP